MTGRQLNHAKYDIQPRKAPVGFFACSAVHNPYQILYGKDKYFCKYLLTILFSYLWQNEWGGFRLNLTT